MQLTFKNSGHCLNSTQSFSPDGEWIVYDSRNDDAALAGSGEIRMVHTVSGEDRLLYKTLNQTEFGPGVGAATFSPLENKVLFLTGIKGSDKSNPYAITRRTAVAINTNDPGVPIYMDARDIEAPFTIGALRGGTHAHTWSGDGRWISFTYNDFVLQEAEKKTTDVKDLRTIGVMFPQPVKVLSEGNKENFSGEMFSVVLASVIKDPARGSNEVSKAFDECWVGNSGYKKRDGSWQQRAVAYQGLVKDAAGKDKAEIFIADIDEQVLRSSLKDSLLSGTEKTLPVVPRGVVSRRITFTDKGVSSFPRHWLRTTFDGTLIGFLAEDSQGLVQLFGIAPNGGDIRQLSFMSHSVQGPFNFSPDGKLAAFIADGSVFINYLKTGKCIRLTRREEGLRGAVVWSPKGDAVCYNKYVKCNNGQSYLQIFYVKWK